jgi:8-oxo-dGTP diphosphatase / 2-hydroxy-dATP diphosphatase
MNKVFTNLCIVHQHPRVLLAMKKRGLGMGRWNGFGGKLKEGESMLEALFREVKEEGEIEIKDPKLIGIIEFEFPAKGLLLENHIFKVRSFSGEPKETEEMSPKWFHIDEIPFNEMWADDVYWMAMFLKDKKFKGKFVFGEGDVILDKHIEEVENL